jgi:hypothetical protein
VTSDRLAEALHEIATTPRSRIEAETAYKWAARAVAAHQRGWTRDAHDYFHEAIEHAAVADPDGSVLLHVVQWIHQHAPGGL